MDAALISGVDAASTRLRCAAGQVRPSQLVEEACLRDISTEPGAVLARLSLLLAINGAVARTLPFLGQSRGAWGGGRASRACSAPSPPTSPSAEPAPTSAQSKILGSIKGAVLASTKQSVLAAFLKATSTTAKKADDDYDYPPDLAVVQLNRLAAAASQSSESPQRRFEASVLGQLYAALHSKTAEALRIGYAHPMDDGQDRAFKVKFAGEGVDDYGGPYREVFSQVDAPAFLEMHIFGLSQSLRRRLLPLFVPHADGETFTLPTCGSPLDHALDVYYFLGQLFGIALRSKVSLPMRLTPHFWKRLVGETRAFEDVDAASLLKRLWACASDAQVEALQVPRRAPTSDGSQVDLFSAAPRGAAAPVLKTLKEAELFGLVLAQRRLCEADAAISAVRNGLMSIVPPAALALFGPGDLERQICGEEEIDVDLLARNTEYDEGLSPTDAHIEHFWAVLRGFGARRRDSDRAAFLRFVWARSRVPAAADGVLQQKFKIQASGENVEDADTFLPRAHTCFFSLNLPRYSTRHIMEQKLRYAIENCIEMDGDFKVTDDDPSAWVI
ncbi:hypothetical protein M885DRAFT_446505 [Pelagophyceae sp. CCMP2097]|nr:hypothetical protein M885DRAFT_446505 [Pelagophyceae sp. CCMP2097]